jgi:hypothetical protein
MKLTYIFWDVVCVVGQVVTDILKDHTAFIFKLKQSSSSLKKAP